MYNTGMKRFFSKKYHVLTYIQIADQLVCIQNLFILLLIMCCLSTISCEKKQNKSTEGLKIGYSVQDLSNSYFQVLSNGMQDRARELNVHLEIVNAAMDPEKQVEDLYYFINEKYDMIICSPVQPTACIEPFKEAREAGILCINPNQTIPGSDAYINLDDFTYGRLGGEIAGTWIAEKLKDFDPVTALIIGYDSVELLKMRAQGIKYGILEKAPNTIILDTISALTPERGMIETEKALKAHPEILVIAAVNDAAALGAMTSVLSLGNYHSDFCIVGLDATSESLKLIEQGNTIFRGTVDINPYSTGIEIMNIANKVYIDGPLNEVVPINMIPIYWNSFSESHN